VLARSGGEDEKRLPVIGTARPTQSGPRLTGAEAAGMAERKVREEVLPLAAEQGVTGVSIFCEPEDFNEGSQSWIVLCYLDGRNSSFSYRFKVDDRTGDISDIR